MFCIADHLENGREMRNGTEAEQKQVQCMQDPNSAEPESALFRRELYTA